MIKVSASYSYINPNFVIQNISEPKKWNQPLFAILKNILMRGCPTLPSLFLREVFNYSSDVKNFEYKRSFDNLNWDNLIKGGDKTNPALEFYKNILPKLVSVPGSFIPECPVCDILEDVDKKDLGNVDFFSPLYNTVIEIDGKQHKEGEQKAKDALRDNLFSRYKINTIRIPVENLANFNNVRKSFESLIKEVKRDELLNKKDMPYLFAIRLQCVLLYLYATEKIRMDSKKINLNLFGDFYIDKAQVIMIIKDFFLWIENIAGLLNISFTVPDVDVRVFTDEKIFESSNGIKIDISLSKVYCDEHNKEVYYVRNDYFEYETYPYKRILKDMYYAKGKNYFCVANAQIKYNISIDLHKKYLLYILRNVSIEYDNFRANQLEIIIEALNNRSVIGVLPTGAGKSLCYQFSALLIPGMTVVVAPLKLLMVDQYEHLRDKLGINQATYINSSHTEHISLFERGQSIITLVSPERFFSEKFAQVFTGKDLKSAISFMVIDEAHCLSEWGHDFRTSYLCLSHNLGRLLPADTFLMALTGTASHSVFRDIENEFYYFKKKPTKSVFADDMRRTNLNIYVKKFEDNRLSGNSIFDELRKEILPTIKGYNKDKTLIFTKTKTARATDPEASACIPLSKYFSDLASENGITNVIGYFAGNVDMSDAEKDQVLADFKNDTDLRVLFATKAFGMGIDIKDIRKTIHYGLPSSMESLYQQIGRAGRDGKKSDCYVYFRVENQADYDYFFSQRNIKIKDIYENQNRLKELATNFYFIQNANLDVNIEKEVAMRIYKGIKKRNSVGSNYVDCHTICKALIDSVSDNHLNELLGKFVTINNRTCFVAFQNANIIIERALYRLYLLGEIGMWNVVYSSDITNPMYNNLKSTDLSDEDKYNRLVNHIERYESRAMSMPTENTFEARLEKLLTWSYENFVLERIKSMKTLYDWCVDFTSSNNFMRRLADYFSNDPVYVRLTDKSASIDDLLSALFRNANETKLRIARLLESYENIDLLNYLSGITRLRLGEFSEFDGERRLDMSFEGIKLMTLEERKKLFMGTMGCLNNKETEDIFSNKWLGHLTEDVFWIYDKTANKQAEKYLIADFADRLLSIKEKIHDKLR